MKDRQEAIVRWMCVWCVLDPEVFRNINRFQRKLCCGFLTNTVPTKLSRGLAGHLLLLLPPQILRPDTVAERTILRRPSMIPYRPGVRCTKVCLRSQVMTSSGGEEILDVYENTHTPKQQRGLNARARRTGTGCKAPSHIVSLWKPKISNLIGWLRT